MPLRIFPCEEIPYESCNQKVSEVEFSYIFSAHKNVGKINKICSSFIFNKNLNRSNPLNIFGLMNVRESFLAHLVKFNGLQDVFNFYCL